MTSASADRSIVFSVQEAGGSPTGLDPENRVGDQDIGSPSRPVSSGLPCLAEKKKLDDSSHLDVVKIVRVA